MVINFYDVGTLDHDLFMFAVICAEFNHQWIFVRHKKRDTWELPAGHRERGEHIDCAARRELFEETGALRYDIRPVYDFMISTNNTKSFGRLYDCKVMELGPLPPMEIAEMRLFDTLPSNMTYPEIQTHLFNKITKER